MKNWQVAESGSFVRAMAIVPRLFESPLSDSFLIGLACLPLSLPSGRHPAPLDHELGDDAVKDQVVVEPVVNILEEVLDRDRGFVRIELQGDRSLGGVEHDDRVSAPGPARRSRPVKDTLPDQESQVRTR